MAKFVSNILDLIGDTPIVKINKLIDEDSAEILLFSILDHPKVQNKPHTLVCGKTQGLFDFQENI